MRYFEDYRQQTILALLQAGVIVGGSLLVGAFMKALGYSDGQGQELPLVVLFVRNWGFSLVAIPLAWVLGTVWMERHQEWYAKRYTLFSGLLLFGGLCWFLIYVAARATSITMRMAD